GVLGLFLFLVVLARLGPTSGPTIRERQTFLTEEQRAALQNRVDTLEARFLNSISSVSVIDEEALQPLLAAIEAQRELNQSGDTIVPLRDAERLENLLRQRDFHFGNLLFAQSQAAEEAAERAAAESRFEEALKFLRGARELQERINVDYPRAESRSSARLRTLETRITELQAAPIFEASTAAETRARTAMQNGHFEQAVIEFREAFQKQEELQRDFRASRFASVARLRSLERDLMDARAAIAHRAVEAVLENATAALSLGNTQRAAALFSEAFEKQRELNQNFPGSRFATSARLQEIEVNRQNALAGELASSVNARIQRLPDLLVRRQVREAQALLSELNRLLNELDENFPLSRQVNPATIAKTRYLLSIAEDIDAVQSHVHGNLRALPGNTEGTQMLATEVNQLLFSKIMLGENPATVRGEHFPVESVSWNEAVQFCERLSWVMGMTVRLPTRAEFEAALGDVRQYDIDALSWNSQNTNREIQPVARRQPNSVGFFDLLGNVAEWLTPDDVSADQLAPVIGGSVRDNPRALLNVPVENRLRNERNRITGFRFVVQ
ncbi:MAG: formylglycine-generating enzyme family protein, partial [Verrucomicrobia bacterium]|nr:formylglycine-generating enzyme family protein [Verrucomicrobiota bacterium]